MLLLSCCAGRSMPVYVCRLFCIELIIFPQGFCIRVFANEYNKCPWQKLGKHISVGIQFPGQKCILQDSFQKQNEKNE